MTWLAAITITSSTYRYRDPVKRRAQMRQVMRRGRARLRKARGGRG